MSSASGVVELQIQAEGPPDSADAGAVGTEMYRLMERLYPICRSITGDGVRRTFAILNELIPLEIVEIPTGTPVFDWTVPKEWNVRDAYVKDSSGRRVIDFQRSNLHVMGYSVPVHRKMRLSELEPHLFSLAEHPDWVPNRTSYYHEDWGFCLAHNRLLGMEDDEYEVCIDSTLEDGSLTYAECLVPGATADEVLIYTHSCHPSLANDNLSGVALTTYLARWLASQNLRYSYRLVFGPGAIGSITWLAKNESKLHRIRHGLIAVLVGDSGRLTYKRSRQGGAEIDRIVTHVLKSRGADYEVQDFIPYGYDERQFCSPGINLPVGRLTRSPCFAYPEYHTSADNMDLVKPDALADSYATYLQVIKSIERNRRYLNKSPKCEPQLGRRGLYSKTGGYVTTRESQMALLWVLNLADGEHALLDIAERSGMSLELLDEAAQALIGCDLLEPVEQPTNGNLENIEILFDDMGQ